MIWCGEYPAGDAIVDGSDRSGLPLCARDTKQRMAAIVLMMMMMMVMMMTLMMMTLMMMMIMMTMMTLVMMMIIMLSPLFMGH